jgi:3-hydroxyacyl-CoA dehydrogenase/enoyl-CoA hydratase/3-hydroxybutyryl-CoA epimerase
MGGDIAAWCAQRGLTVTLQDQGMERIAPALQRAYAAWGKRIRDARELRNVMDRLIPDPDGHGARQADVVIEAIFEEPRSQARAAPGPRSEDQERRRAGDQHLQPADRRSAQPVLARPERLIGIHFFNPVARMPLVEVVAAEGSRPRSACNAASPLSGRSIACRCRSRARPAFW